MCKPPIFRVFASPAPWGNFSDVTVETTLKIHGGIQSSAGLELLSAQGSHKLARVMVATSGLLKVDLTRLKRHRRDEPPANPNDFFILRNNASTTATI